ncbi:MAG: hypothetical protein ACI9QD_000020 [Thermoproteota archaeon]|jgi:hypothetical protein
MKKLLIKLSLLGTLVSGTANAGFLVEPYVGYGITAFEHDSSSLEFAVNGASYGFRGGATWMGFFAALDYEIGSRSLELESGSTSITLADYDMTNIGLTVGYNVPVLPLRVYGKYITNSSFEASSTEFEGDGIGFGLGLTFLPFVDINIEYRTYDLEVSNSAYSGKEITLGLSLPFDLL